MFIAVSIRTTNAQGYDEKRDALSWDWAHFFNHWNITPVLIPNSLKNIDLYFDQIKIQGLLLTGGDDLGPLDNPSRRDLMEFKLLDIAHERNIPVLGVCRGLLVINRYFGGDIVPNTDVEGSLNHVNNQHSINWIETGKTYSVNSYHNYHVEQAGVAPSLRVLALSDDLAVEALQHESKRVKGIMWHPERKHNACDLDADIVEKWLC